MITNGKDINIVTVTNGDTREGDQMKVSTSRAGMVYPIPREEDETDEQYEARAKTIPGYVGKAVSNAKKGEIVSIKLDLS